MCELRMMEVMSSGTSSDEENEEHNVENVSGGCGAKLVRLADQNFS